MEQNNLMLPRMLKEKQAAEMLEVSKAALRKWRREGRGPQFAKFGRCIRHNVHAIEEFLAKHSSK